MIKHSEVFQFNFATLWLPLLWEQTGISWFPVLTITYLILCCIITLRTNFIILEF